MLAPMYELGLLGALADVVLDEIFGIETDGGALEPTLLLFGDPEPKVDA